MVYRFGTCILDPQRHRLQRGGQPVRLRPKAFQALLYLLTHRDRTALKQELYEQVWPEQFISEATLESTLREVRRAIGDSGRAQQLIQTVHGYGYRFVAAVEELTDIPVEINARGMGVLQDAVAAHQQNPSVATPPPSVCGPGEEPETRKGWDGQPQAGKPTPDGSGPPGEWKLVTVLCCAPAMTAGRGAPQEAEARYRRLLSLYALAQPIVQRYGGTLQPVLGGHLLIVFGAPMAQEDHAHRSVLAALELQRQARGGEMGGNPAQGDVLGLRIGLATGQVAVSGMGDFAAESQAVVGDTVMRSVMLQARAAPGEALCTDTTAHLVRDAVRLAAVDPVPVVGEPIPIPACRILGPYTPACLLGQWEQRLRTPFIGRLRDLATLGVLMAQVQEGQGQVVGVIGEPGVGKSRLCYEFIRGSIAPPWLILETQGKAYGQATPYLPIIDLLKGYFRLEAHDDCLTVTEKVTSRLLHCDDALNPAVSALLALLDVPVDDPQWQALEATQRRQRTIDAIKRLLLWESQRQPLLLVIENLHWIDTESQAALDLLIESLSAARLFLIVTYRPEYRHGWGSKTSYTQLRLDPLPRDSVHALLNALLGDDAALAPVKQRLRERTQGNPFFMEESVRMLVERQDLVGEPGAYRLATAPLRIQVPATVQAVLAARIDRLPVEAKHLLQCAAVIGTEIPFALLQAIAQTPEGELQRSLAHLQSVELLYEARLFPELTYTFKHALTQEVAYGNLLQARRCALHARTVMAMETLYAPHPTDHVDRLAYHALRGEVWDRAVAYCHQAGVKAGGRFAYREAVACLEQALEALAHLPEGRDTLEQGIDLRMSLRTALLPLGEFRRLHDLLREALPLAQALGDGRRLAWISDRLCHASWQMGNYKAAIEFGQQALAIGIALGDVPLQLPANVNLACAYHALGDYGRAITCCRAAVSLEGVLPPPPTSPTGRNDVNARAWLSQCLAELGMFEEGITHGEEAIRMAEARDHPFSRASAYGSLGHLYLRQGDLRKAIALLKRGMELCQVWQIQFYFPHVASPLGVAYALSGRLGEALPLLERAVEQSVAMRFIPYISRGLAALSEANLVAGRLAEAALLAQQALDVARQHQEQGNHAWAVRLLGQIAAQRNPPDVEQAEEHYHQALALADTLRTHPLMAHCHLGLGTLYAKVRWREQACAELSTAVERYRAMGMPFWLSRAEAVLAQMGG